MQPHSNNSRTLPFITPVQILLPRIWPSAPNTICIAWIGRHCLYHWVRCSAALRQSLGGLDCARRHHGDDEWPVDLGRALWNCNFGSGLTISTFTPTALTTICFYWSATYLHEITVPPVSRSSRRRAMQSVGVGAAVTFLARQLDNCAGPLVYAARDCG